MTAEEIMPTGAWKLNENCETKTPQKTNKCKDVHHKEINKCQCFFLCMHTRK